MLRQLKYRLVVLTLTCVLCYFVAFNWKWKYSYIDQTGDLKQRKSSTSNNTVFPVAKDIYIPPKIFPEHDLMELPPFVFNPDFKNPCWYETADDSSQLRCLPYFYIIGVKKSGTSDLFFRINQHPQVVHPGLKEAQWFPRKRFSNNQTKTDLNFYIDMMSAITSRRIERETITYKGNTNYHPLITGEGTPANLHLNPHWRLLPGNEDLKEPKYVILDYIRHITPNVKIIIIFRNPIDRLYSDYFHEFSTLRKTNNPSQQQFHTIVTEGIQMYEECFKVMPLRACVYEGSIYRKTKIQIQLGLYSVFWRELLRVFPLDQILYLHTNEYATNKRGTMEKVFSFLQLSDLSDERMVAIENIKETYQRAARNKAIGPMWNSTRLLLYNFYKPFSDEMVQLTGDERFRLHKP